MVAIEQKISNCESGFQEAKVFIQRGSDEHLDVLLAIKECVERATKKTQSFIKDVAKDFNEATDEELTQFIPKLYELYAAAIGLVAVLKRSTVCNDLKSACSNLFAEIDNLRELIFDLDRLRLSDDDELDQIMLDINAI